MTFVLIMQFNAYTCIDGDTFSSRIFFKQFCGQSAWQTITFILLQNCMRFYVDTKIVHLLPFYLSLFSIKHIVQWGFSIYSSFAVNFDLLSLKIVGVIVSNRKKAEENRRKTKDLENHLLRFFLKPFVSIWCDISYRQCVVIHRLFSAL